MALNEITNVTAGSRSISSDLPIANTTDTSTINPFLGEQAKIYTKPLKKEDRANIEVFTNDSNDVYAGNARASKIKAGTPNLFVNKNGIESDTQFDFEKANVAPLLADTFDNPIKKEKKINFGKLLKGLLPQKKTPLGEIPNEADLTLAINTAFKTNPRFREAIYEIERQGIA